LQQELLELLHLSLLNPIETLALHIQLGIRNPALDTKNSPVITPTSERPIFIFKEFINVAILAGIIILLNNCSFVQLKVLAILIFSLSVSKKPFKISIMVTTKEIASAITIIAGVPAPTQIIIIGPKCNFW